MSETQSTADDKLFLLEGLEAFSNHAIKLIRQTSRNLYILSNELDFPLYSKPEIVSGLSTIARQDRNASIRILVKKTRPLVERNHQILAVARKLPSKISIRKLTLEPEDDDRAYLISDRRGLLYKRDDREYSGFANYNAGPEVSTILDDFNYLWQQHSIDDVELRSLSL